MSCGKWITVTHEIASKNGGMPVLSQFIKNPSNELDEKNPIEKLISMRNVDSRLKIIINPDEHSVFTEKGFFDVLFIEKMVKMSHDEFFETIYSMGNPSDIQGKSIAEFMIGLNIHGYLTYDEIKKLENPIGTNSRSLAHVVAERGYIFSKIELKELNNIKDTFGRTVAHYMIKEGHNFSLDELLYLENVSDRKGRSLAHYMVSYHQHKFSRDEIVALGNPSDSAGSTLWEEVRQSWIDEFSQEDIDFLDKLSFEKNGRYPFLGH